MQATSDLPTCLTVKQPVILITGVFPALGVLLVCLAMLLALAGVHFPESRLPRISIIKLAG